jgi:hypothetical protein
MQIGSRFTEYGLTGGFFWICQLLFLTYSGQRTILLSNLPSNLDIPSWILPSVSTAISALAIVAVFVAGLLLDLSAVYFRQWEMRVFHRHLVRNRDWLGRFIADHKGYCEADYEEFERQLGKSSLAKDRKAGFGVSLLWNRERRQQYFAVGWGPWKGARPYERLWSFFASYVLVESGSSQLSLMTDQYYLWRTGRTISTSLAILMLEVWVLTLGHSSLFSSRHTPISPFVSIIMWALAAVAIMITLGTYSRLCFTLFSLVYVTQAKRTVELAKSA